MSTAPGLTFILGLPYSGSSLFALALGNADGFCNCGEISYVENDWHDRRSCTCGALVTDCVFWAPLKAEMDAALARGEPALNLEAGQKLRPIDARKLPLGRTLALWLGRPLQSVFSAAELDDYASRHAAFLRAVLRQTGAFQVVDSSKNVRRLEVLLQRTDLPVRVVYLERQPAAAFGARLKRARRRNRFYLPILAPLYLGWMLYHRIQTRRCLRMLPAGQMMTISYEQFATDPSAVAAELSGWFGRPVDFGIDADHVLKVTDTHVFTGNVWLTRKKGFDAGVRINPPADRPELTGFEHAVFRLGARLFPILRRTG